MAYPSVSIGPNPLDSIPDITMPAPRVSGGMFGGGGGKWQNALLAAVAGFMARRNPSVSNNLINGLQSSMELKQKLALAQQQRQQQFSDARLAHQQDRQFDIANPMPTQDDELTRHMIAAGIDPASPQGKAAYAASMDPVVMTPQGPMLRSQLLGNGGQPAPEGVTFTPASQGGAGGNVSGGFPRPY